MSAQILSSRTLRRMSRRFAMPFTFGWARGGYYYRLHTHNHTYYLVTFRGRRRGSRQYVLKGPIDVRCQDRNVRLHIGPCLLNDLVPVPHPDYPGELVGRPR